MLKVGWKKAHNFNDIRKQDIIFVYIHNYISTWKEKVETKLYKRSDSALQQQTAYMLHVSQERRCPGVGVN